MDSDQAARRVPRRLRLAVVGGVPVYLSASWAVVAALVTYFFADTVRRLTGVDDVAVSYLAAFGLAVLLAVSVLVHEAAHAVAARAFGLPVAEVVVDLWGGHTALARPRGPGASAVISVLGPLANLALAALVWAAQQAFTGPQAGSVAAVVSFLLLGTAFANLLVGVFNLVPGLPLDGGRALEAVVWRLTGDQDLGTVVAAWVGRVLVVVLGVVGALFARDLGIVSLLWIVLGCVFLWRGASAALRVGQWRRRAAAVDLGAASVPLLAVHSSASVDQLVRALAADGVAPGTEVVLVDDSGRPVGLVGPGTVADVPEHLRTSTAASSLSVVLPPTAVLPSDAGPVSALEALARSGSAGVVLVDGPGRPVARLDPVLFAAAMGVR